MAKIILITHRFTEKSLNEGFETCLLQETLHYKTTKTFFVVVQKNGQASPKIVLILLLICGLARSSQIMPMRFSMRPNRKANSKLSDIDNSHSFTHLSENSATLTVLSGTAISVYIFV